MNALIPIAAPELRLPPHNFEAEMALLGAVLTDPRTISAASEIIAHQHFADDRHAQIWAAIVLLDAQGVKPDVVMLKGHLERADGLQAIGGTQYLSRLRAAAVSTINVKDYARVIRDCWQRRATINVCEDAVVQAHDDQSKSAQSIIESMEAQLCGIVEVSHREAVHIGAAAQTAIDMAEEAHRRGNQLVGITTGFNRLDGMLSGLEPGSVYILAARPSMGKTALGMGIAWNTAKAGNPVAFFSLEMSAAQLGRRVIAPLCGISLSAMKAGDIRDGDGWSKMLAAQKEISGVPIWIDDQAGQTIAAIRARSIRLKRRHALKLIVIDHLGLVMPSPEAAGQGATFAIGQASNAVKRMAKELDVPVLLLHQLNRGVEGREDKRPTLSDLRQSGEIEQDADVVMFIYRESYYLERMRPQKRAGENDIAYHGRTTEWSVLCNEVRGKADVIIGKQRDGPIGTVPMAFDDRTTRFSTLKDEDDAQDALDNGNTPALLPGIP